MKYFAASLMFLFNDEVVSTIALCIMMGMFLYDIVKERFFT